MRKYVPLSYYDRVDFELTNIVYIFSNEILIPSVIEKFEGIY